MGLPVLVGYTAGSVLTAAALNNNETALANQLGNIEAVNLANLAVTTAKINTGAVTFVKLDTGIIQGATTVTGVPTDYLAIADTSDSGKFKKCLASDFITVAASQAEMEAFTEDAKMATPANMNWHPGMAKAWGRFDGTGTPAFASRYNMDASITDNGAGDYTVAFTTDFSAANAYSLVGMPRRAGGTASGVLNFDASVDPAAGTCRILSLDGGSTLVDKNIICFVAFGDQ